MSCIEMATDRTGTKTALGDYRNDVKPVVIVDSQTGKHLGRVDFGHKAKRTKEFDDEWPGISYLALAPDADWVASAHDDGSVYLWDANSGKQLGRIFKVAKKDPSAPLVAANPSPSTRRIYVLSDDDGAVLTWSIPKVSSAFVIPSPSDGKKASVPGAKLIATAGGGGRIAVFADDKKTPHVSIRDGVTLKPLLRVVVDVPQLFTAAGGSARSRRMCNKLALNHDGSYCMLARDADAVIWDVSSHSPAFSLENVKRLGSAAAASPTAAVVPITATPAGAGAASGLTIVEGSSEEGYDPLSPGAKPSADSKVHLFAIVSGSCDATGNWVLQCADVDEAALDKCVAAPAMRIIGGTPDMHKAQLAKANTILAATKGTAEEGGMCGLTRFVAGTHMPRLLRECLFDEATAFLHEGSKDTTLASRKKVDDGFASESDDEVNAAATELLIEKREAPPGVRQESEKDSDDDDDDDDDEDDDDDVKSDGTADDDDDDVDSDLADAAAKKPAPKSAAKPVVVPAKVPTAKKSSMKKVDSWGDTADDSDADDDADDSDDPSLGLGDDESDLSSLGLDAALKDLDESLKALDSDSDAAAAAAIQQSPSGKAQRAKPMAKPAAAGKPARRQAVASDGAESSSDGL
jgi:hypothetical protein